MQLAQSSNCPLCQQQVRNVKNHVRMSSDEVHGPQGQYPDDFPDSSAETSSSESDPEPSRVDLDLEADSSSADVLEADDDQEAEALETLELGDDPGDASNYECAACDDRLEYHQERCKCGERPMWRVAN